MPLAAAKSARSMPAASLFHPGRIGRLLARGIDSSNGLFRALERALRSEHVDHFRDRIYCRALQESALHAAGRRKTERARVDDGARWNAQRAAEPEYHASPAIVQRAIGFVDKSAVSRLAHATGGVANAKRAPAENRQIEIATGMPQRAAVLRRASCDRDPQRG